MRIPGKGLEKFVREIANMCLVSQRTRIERGAIYRNYALYGADQPAGAALYNKTYAYLDDVASLLFSPISLRFHIGDPDYPNVVEEVKGRAAAAKLRNLSRQSDTDTMISEATLWGLIKGCAFAKQTWERGGFSPTLIQPEAMGVLNENHDKLDINMEAFTHSYLVTPFQFQRMIWDHPRKESLMRKARNYTREARTNPAMGGAMKQVVVGGYQPFRAQGQPQTGVRGIVDWMGGPGPEFSAQMLSSLMQVDETWIWDDVANDWATFKIIGDDLLLNADTQVRNEFAFDTASGQSNPTLKGKHPFTRFCPNILDGYFWGRSEIVNVALLQEAINSRLNGINKMLRKQEDPPLQFKGGSVNAQAYARYNKPGGWITDPNPNAAINPLELEVPATLFASLHELERMFDEMGGVPQFGKGKGGEVRSGGHAETLLRMFSARFKDRAVLIERSVEELGGLMLDMGRVYVDKKLIGWANEAEAGNQGAPLNGLTPPAKGMVPIPFSLADLDDDVTLTVDSHSSSPAFMAEAKALAFDLYKIGAMSAEDVIERSDVSDPENLISGVQRRAVAKAEAEQKEAQMKLLQGGKR